MGNNLEPCYHWLIEQRVDKLHYTTPLRTAVRVAAGDRFWKNKKLQRRFIIAAVANRLEWIKGIHSMVVTGIKYTGCPRYFWDRTLQKVVIIANGRGFTDNDLNLYTPPTQEEWDATRCEKESKRRASNGYGDKDPAGLIVHDSAAYPRYGTQVFNGGYIAPDGKHYDGYSIPFPKLADGYCWVFIWSWGYFCMSDTKAKEVVNKKQGRIVPQ